MLESELWHKKQKPKMQRMQEWWNLSKLVTITLASLILVVF